MKCALFKGLISSSFVAGVCAAWVGRNRVIREKSDGCAGGGRFRIDFPGTGIVTADEDGGHDEPEDVDVDVEDI